MLFINKNGILPSGFKYPLPTDFQLLAQLILYSGTVSGAGNVKQALDLMNSRINNIVSKSGESITELVDSRYSSVKEMTFSLLNSRFDDIEEDMKRRGIDPRWFGVKYDGSDETSAFTNCLNHALERGLPIYITGPIVISGISKDGNGTSLGKLTMIGNDKAKIKLRDGSNKSLLFLSYLDHFCTIGIEYDGNKSNQSAGAHNCLEVRYCKNLVVNRNTIHDGYYMGLYVRGCQVIDIRNNHCYLNGTGNSYPGDGMLVVAGRGSIIKNFCYNNNPILGEDGDGIQLGATNTEVTGWWSNSDIRYINVEGNHCYGNGRRGIKIQRSFVNCLGNTCYENGTKQISVVHDSITVKDVIIADNMMGNDNTTSMATFSVEGISAKHKNITVVNNVFAGTVTNNAIDLEWLEDSKVTNNIHRWTSVTANQYYLRSNTSNVKIEAETNSLVDYGVNNKIILSNNFELKSDKITVLAKEFKPTSNCVEEVHIRRKLLAHGVNTNIFEVGIQPRQSIAIHLSYLLLQVDASNVPINSAYGFSVTGSVIVQAYSDTDGNISVSTTPDVRQNVVEDGGPYTPTVTWGLSPGTNKVTIGVTHNNTASRNLTLIGDAKVLKYSTSDSVVVL